MQERRSKQTRLGPTRSGVDRRVVNLGSPTGTERRSGQDRRKTDRRKGDRRRAAAAGS